MCEHALCIRTFIQAGARAYKRKKYRGDTIQGEGDLSGYCVVCCFVKALWIELHHDVKVYATNSHLRHSIPSSAFTDLFFKRTNIIITARYLMYKRPWFCVVESLTQKHLLFEQCYVSRNTRRCAPAPARFGIDFLLVTPKY